MHERNVMGRESGASVVTASFIAIVIIAALVALFVWEPWDTTPSRVPATQQSIPANGVDRAAH